MFRCGVEVRINGGWRSPADDEAKTTQVPELRDVVPTGVTDRSHPG